MKEQLRTALAPYRVIYDIHLGSVSMDLNLAGRVVIVTGASKGIGYACAEAFAAEGARVALVSRSQANLDAALARFPRGRSAPIAIAADMTSCDAAEEMVATVEKTLGDIDVLVNS